MSNAVMIEIIEVLHRRRTELLAAVQQGARWFEPAQPITDCGDPRDDEHLELAFTAQAQMIVTGDRDLLVLDPCGTSGSSSLPNTCS